MYHHVDKILTDADFDARIHWIYHAGGGAMCVVSGEQFARLESLNVHV